MVAEFEEVCTQIQGKRVSLIAGMEYEMERWNGRWNGMVNEDKVVRISHEL